MLQKLSAETLAELRAMLTWWRSHDRPTVPPSRQQTPRVRVFIAKTQAGGVPAREDDTPGVADVDLWDFDPETGDLQAREDSEGNQVTVEVVNVATSAVSGDKFIQMKEHVSGRLLIDFEECT